MTPLRQAVHAALVAAALAIALPTRADPLPLVGPPPPPVPEAPAVVLAPVAPLALAKAPLAPGKAPAWLSARPKAKVASGQPGLPSSGRMLGLLLVVGSLGGAAFYLKRRGKPERGRAPTPQRLSVVSSTRIGPKAHAVVIQVAGRQILLGVTDSSVKRLAFIDDEEREEEREPARRPVLPGLASPKRAAPPATRVAYAEPIQGRSFGDLLKTAFKKREPEKVVDAAVLIAAETHDTVGGRPAPSNVRMLDVEGQAQGLIKRLSGPRA
jgi:flagellar biogenesis protein FliO